MPAAHAGVTAAFLDRFLPSVAISLAPPGTKIMCLFNNCAPPSFDSPDLSHKIKPKSEIYLNAVTNSEHLRIFLLQSSKLPILFFYTLLTKLMRLNRKKKVIKRTGAIS